MEENESSLLNSQQEPDNNSAESQPAAERKVTEVEHVTAPTPEAEAEALAKEISEAPDEVTEETTEAVSFNVRTQEELHMMTDEEILGYLKEIAQTRPARPASEAVAAPPWSGWSTRSSRTLTKISPRSRTE
ncbi:MAG: hypothetical protein U0K36_11475, partial [Bacteroidales bacterium]|nr:hypothetical protein [Bacteroidales bacterium]